MDNYTVAIATILLVGVPLLALIWMLVGRDDVEGDVLWLVEEDEAADSREMVVEE